MLEYYDIKNTNYLSTRVNTKKVWLVLELKQAKMVFRPKAIYNWNNLFILL